jgi:hypothetical protein
MADFTVSALIDSFMQSADAAAARQALGVDVPYTATVTNEATFLLQSRQPRQAHRQTFCFILPGILTLPRVPRL